MHNPSHPVQVTVAEKYDPAATAILAPGDCLDTLRSLPDNLVSLAVTSPPYNLGKEYEVEKDINEYLEGMRPIIEQVTRVLKPNGSVCWQVGTYVHKGEIYPLDVYYYDLLRSFGLKLRNRIIWHFGHGLHGTRRFSGRYEVVLWLTRSDEYTFNLDDVRVPQKYRGKRHFKGERRGQPSGNRLGKNPSDFWVSPEESLLLTDEWESAIWNIPNVKANHPEDTSHPAQFPIELVERCVLALTDPSDWVLDPFAGVGTSVVAALKRGRRAIGCEKQADYLVIAQRRIDNFVEGTLRYRPMGKPVAEPTGREKVAREPEEWVQPDVNGVVDTAPAVRKAGTNQARSA